MKNKILLSAAVVIGLSTILPLKAAGQTDTQMLEEAEEAAVIDSLANLPEIKDPAVFFDSLPTPEVNYNVLNRSFNPRVFGGYRKIHKTPDFMRLKPYNGLQVMTALPDSTEMAAAADNLATVNPELALDEQNLAQLNDTVKSMNRAYEDFVLGKRPKWLNDALLSHRIQEDLMYVYMIENPEMIEYADWNLPEPPVLYEDDVTFMTFLKRQELPDVDPSAAIIPEVPVKKKHWLHMFNTLLQFSQAYVSPNWYQGGNNYLALLFNFTWNVQLNQVYHPNLLFQSNLTYKLALSSTPKGSVHKYLISDDAFQYNLNAGLKAYKDWYYSFNMLFKTQLFNNYEENSWARTASILSPGDLNMGIGMSYSHKNKLKTFQYTLTISPLSYNLKTCISDKIDHAQFNIAPNRKSKSEIGSNAEFNMEWKVTSNISYKTRMFIFTDYSYFLGDWQNTFNFDINKFLSTQLFVHLRWDTDAEKNTSWKTFMMREILSFGLSYTFSTKP